MLDSRPKGCGFEPHRRHCVVSLSKNINPSLVLVQPRKIRPFITERLSKGRKVSNQTNKHKKTNWSRDIEDIYFFEVNTKYISSSAVKKISIFHECVARVKMLIFSPHEMKYIWYLPKKSKFSLYFILNENTEITILLFTWSFLVRFDFCSVFIGYNIWCKRSLHLENGLESYFNECNARNQHLKKVY